MRKVIWFHTFKVSDLHRVTNLKVYHVSKLLNNPSLPAAISPKLLPPRLFRITRAGKLFFFPPSMQNISPVRRRRPKTSYKPFFPPPPFFFLRTANLHRKTAGYHLAHFLPSFMLSTIFFWGQTMKRNQQVRGVFNENSWAMGFTSSDLYLVEHKKLLSVLSMKKKLFNQMKNWTKCKPIE